MVSSDVFGTSPLGDTSRQPLHVNSSSPDLPSLRDVLTTKATSQPPIQNGSRAATFPIDGPSGFISARQLYPPTEPTPNVVSAPSTGSPWTLPNHGEAPGLAEDVPENGGFIAEDTEPPKEREERIEVIKITGKSTRKPRQQKLSKQAAPKRAAKAKATTKKQSSKATGKEPAPADDNDDECTETKPKKSRAAKPRKKTGTMSNHFPPAEAPEVLEKAKQVDANEPLHLEQAPARRLDWTPPAQKTILVIDSDSSVFKKLGSSEADQRLPIFKNLVEGYSCMEGSSESTSHGMVNASDEDSSFLKKRKRIELLTTKGTNSPVTAPDKSPTKKPPKKKKPRTITELATAAYRVPSQSDTELSNTSILDHFPTANNKVGSVADEQPKNAKGKNTSRRKTSKAPKKKEPPKPVLLSPSAALAQVANQDFVFGTSSQLAREESPTVLRDLQAALRQSNQNDDIDFAIPLDSGAIGPPEQRSKLWNAAARDAEGDLFDVEVINLIEDTGLSEVGNHSNPFGYQLAADESVVCVESRVVDNDPHVKPSDDIPSPGEKDLIDPGADSPYFSDSELSTSTNIHRPVPAQMEVSPANQITTEEEPESLPELPAQPPRPIYEGFTDIRLAREIKRFGFKPIKRRSAMIALLDQCWQSKARMGQTSLHTSTKLSSPISKNTRAKSPATTSSPKKPRGRPRKNSISAPEPQEPPPSAQPPETPKRPRGRPRKDSLSSTSSSASPSKSSKPASKPKRTAASPRRKKAPTKSVIEIPDSEDNGSDFASSPDTNAEQMFSSPPPLDMSLTTNDGTPLTATQSDQEVLLFDHITNAVTSAPRTTDPQEPSWHEKILLYDPIVLEDLAAWLNTGELSRVGYDGEVNPNDVKKWCESKSICCLWRVNLRGKERKRF
ncbi:hypothetical protein IL306_006572 [Fusarium sp. DS 682]|nr:hypothetical protein IL306_006572 [Fusarium sp. DS 682]